MPASPITPSVDDRETYDRETYDRETCDRETYDRAQRHARALLQHQRVMDESARLRKIAEQARRLAGARPVFADGGSYGPAVRSRVEWVPAR